MTKVAAALVAVALAAAAALAVLSENGRHAPAAGPSPSPSPSPTPAPGPMLRFAVIGDFGSGLADQYAVADRMCRVHADKPLDLVVTTGDNIYPDGAPERFDAAFFRPYRCLLSSGVEFHASLGNHDIRTRGGRPELNEPAFGMSGRNYVVRASGVRFVIANSNDLRRRWLRRALNPEAGDRWTVVAFHHPVYSSGVYGGTPALKPELPRMFARKGVDLVLNGHEHEYEATVPLRKIRYVVTGGGGAVLRPCSGDWFTDFCAPRFHFLLVTAGPGEITVKALPPRGRAFHRFTTTGRD